VRGAVWLSFTVVCLAQKPADRLSIEHLEAIHAERVEWMRIRSARPLEGIYQDFRAVSIEQAPDDNLVSFAKATDAQILLAPVPSVEVRSGVVIAPTPQRPHNDPPPQDNRPNPALLNGKKLRLFEIAAKQYPDEALAEAGTQISKTPDWTLTFRHSSIHVLAMSLDPQSVRASVNEGRTYSAADWLCDPAGFSFIATNNLGSFDIGDTVPLIPGTHLRATFPIAAKILLLHDGRRVSETNGASLDYVVKETGSYRLFAFLTIAGEEFPWISTQPINAGQPPAMELPVGPISPAVEVRRNIPYLADDDPKHQLDLYLPRGKTNFPVMIFLHGGAWRSGDRSLYALFGNRFAKAGIGVAIPSYRLMPKNPHPAQIDDAAAAFAWVYRNIPQYGGDRSRLYLAGHSAGGHLAALLALDPTHLAKLEIPFDAIHGVITMSGIYDVGRMTDFQTADDDPSPIHHIHPAAPPFLVTYCQWDYPGLPKQARDFAAKLKAAFTQVKLIYVPGQGHISEMIATLKEDDPAARAILNFIQ
jgi:acetyl esterase/lipase